MISHIKNICCFLILLLVSTLSFAQKQFHITIQFVPKLDTNNLKIILENGIDTQRIPVVVKDGKIEINCKVFSKYAFLNIESLTTSKQKTYFITSEVSSLIFYGNNKSAKDYPFVNGKLINAIDIINSDVAKKFQLYIQKEQKELDNFEQKNGSIRYMGDSLMSIYKRVGVLLDKKMMDFIRLNSNQYFSFWVFRVQLASSEWTNVDSLLLFYQKVLYPKYKNLFEAKYTLEYLKGRTLKINIPAPDFVTKDITGKTITLKQLRGKYVFINIWATWCGPCVEELPLIKKLRDDFSENQLVMISLSEDRTKTILENGIKQYGLNWINVLRDFDLINKYKISSGIPLSFLIDKEGKLVFMHNGGLIDTDEIRNIIKGEPK